MKKPEKTAPKPVIPKKSSLKARQKRPNPAKTPKKRRKIGFSDAIRAVILVGALVAFSASVSFAIIKIHSTLKNPPKPVVPGIEVSELVASMPVEQPVQINAPVEEKPASKPVIAVEQPKPTVSIPSARTVPIVSSSVPSAPPESVSEKPGTLVFIIDDAGNNLRELEPFLNIPFPLTIAVLPGLPHSVEAARRIRAAGKEVFLHQPMEALGAQNPGPGAIYSGMSASEIRAILKRNLEEVGPVAGINNHQGSKITMDRDAVETILSFCAEQGISFVDSRTTAETAVPAVARRLGIKIAERDVFIDNEQDKDSMLRYVSNGLARAQKTGRSVMIGHTWSPELAAVLAEQLPLFVKQGYSLQSASAIIKAE
ncbi:MAG: divergent polysaccharide deacetylase family protein [Treponema sp.]|nr:divergent polysaccharide deacetylase family protein [Treponema sp.]